MAKVPREPKYGLLAWFGDHLFAAVLAFLVALGWASGSARAGGRIAQRGLFIHPQLSRVHSDSWPDGISAWTVVLASASTQGQAEAALDLARRIPSRGMSLGVIRSNDYVDLHRGYWVAFAGQFEGAEEAKQAASRYRSLFATTYQRFIEEK